MNIEYSGIKDVNGPLMVVDGVRGACYEEIVDVICRSGEKRLGRVIQIDGDRAVVQIFEGTEGISLSNTRIKLTGKPMELAVSPDMLGRIFDGAGKPAHR